MIEEMESEWKCDVHKIEAKKKKRLFRLFRVLAYLNYSLHTSDSVSST